MNAKNLTERVYRLSPVLFVIAGLVVLFPSHLLAVNEIQSDYLLVTEQVQGEGDVALKRFDQPQGRNPLTGGTLLYFPPGDLYKPYAADPFRVGFGIQPVFVSKSSIIGASDKRVSLRAGGQLGIMRSQSPGDPNLGWQLSLMGGFNDQNDIHYNLDNIGWDGRYGLLLSAAPVSAWAFKLGLLHVSSHVGDEWEVRTGRQRIGYSRQEVAVAASWFDDKRWRLYAETGRAVTMSNKELQEPWRLQAGAEYESPPVLLNGLVGWYAAADIQSTEERDWRTDIAIQTGFVAHSVGRTWRLGAEWYRGRPPIGEFFQDTEEYVSFGVWIDI